MTEAPRRSSVVKFWMAVTAVGAVVVTIGDALLLQRSRNYFTGGFLSVDYLESGRDVALFAASSLIVDGAFIAVGTALAAWLLKASRLTGRARLFAGALVTVAGLLAADMVAFGVLRYLGDAFDVALMFDLTGRSVQEIVAVASGHLLWPAVLIVIGVVALVVLIVIANRVWAGTAPLAPSRVLPIAAVLMACAGGIVLTAAANGSDALENGLLRKPAGRVIAAAVNRLTDRDRDGFGAVGRNADPDPANAAIYPYALDIPGNGIDEDGVAGDLPVTAAKTFAPAPAVDTWTRRPDVVLIVLESFRADVIGLSQDSVAVTPVLDALAARGVSLARAYSHNGYTVQSRHHLFTGSLLTLPGDTTLVDDFLANGYRVGYFSGQDESFGGPAYDVGFARATVASDARADRARRYSTSTTAGSLAVPLGVVQEHVDAFLGDPTAGTAPLFLYVNFHDTHFPYWHPGIDSLTSTERLPRERIRPGEREALWRTYTNTAANVDRAIGRVLAAVERVRGAAPAVIVTADHGESLYDEGFLGHGYALNDAQTRIPLIAANLHITLGEPFGQADLRGALRAALGAPVAAMAGPVRLDVAQGQVFQYLGDLARPRQVAFLQADGRLIYDFRTRRVQMPDGRWHSPEALSESQRDAFVRLVHFWERLRLARQRESQPAE